MGRLGQRLRRRSPWLPADASVVLTVVGLAFALENRRVAGTEQFFDPVMPALALAFPPVGGLLASRHPRNPVAWLFSAGVLVAVAFAAEQYAVYTLVSEPGALPGGTWAAWLGAWAWVPAYLGVWTLLPLLFPEGRLPSPAWRLLAWVAAALLVGATALAILGPQDANSPAVGNPTAIGGLRLASGPLRAAAMLLLAPACLLALVSRHRKAPAAQQAALRPPVAALAAVVLVPLLVTAVALVIGVPLPLVAYQVVGVVTLLAVPAAVVGAILRHQLLGISLQAETLLNRLLLYSATILLGVGVYAVVSGLLEALVPGDAGLAPSIVGLVAVAATAYPLRTSLQRLVDRVLYRRRRYDYDLLVTLGRQVQSSVGPAGVLPTVVETISAALRLPYVSMTVERDGQVIAAATRGQPVADSLDLPLVHHGEVVGRLAVAPRAPGQAFDAADRRLLDRLAAQVSITAYALCLAADLQRSRERLVTAREEERRRLRRELHDGLKPAIAGVGLGLEAVRNLVGPKSRGSDLLARLKTELDATGAELGRMVYDLRPAALDQLGLVGALRQQATRFELDPAAPEVVVEAPDELPGLPAAVEVAAYRIGQEALENVRKHAGARSCTVQVAIEDGQLRLEVRDDGAGLAARDGGGMGLVTMRERAAELGGTCSVETSAGGGTCVRARLPLAVG